MPQTKGGAKEKPPLLVRMLKAISDIQLKTMKIAQIVMITRPLNTIMLLPLTIAYALYYPRLWCVAG
jgi:hypothetical protein